MNSRLILDALVGNVDYKIDFFPLGEFVFLKNLNEEERGDYSAKMTKIIVDRILNDHQQPGTAEVFDWAKKSAISLMKDYQENPYDEKITRIRVLIELHLKKYEMKSHLPSLFYSSSFQKAKALVNELKRHERVATMEEVVHFFKARKYPEGPLLFAFAPPFPHDVINAFKQMGEEQLKMLLARDFLGPKWRKQSDIVMQDLITLSSSLPSDALRGMFINDVLSKLDPIQVIQLLDRRRKVPYHYNAIFSGLSNPYIDKHLLCKIILQAKQLIDQKKDHAFIEDLFVPISDGWFDSRPESDNLLVDLLTDAMFEYRDQSEDDPHQQFQAQAIINEYHLEPSLERRLKKLGFSLSSMQASRPEEEVSIAVLDDLLFEDEAFLNLEKRLAALGDKTVETLKKDEPNYPIIEA